MEDEDLKFGPNGGLVFCMEYLMENTDWLKEVVGEELDEDYIILDCPGQIELYTHMNVIKKLVELLHGLDF
ncbi:GPN-loop GTPase 3-like, partial [Diaphorina citri]|uniref:GPN-loop GTPase 3 n=1 Tax=Diaphorina citri TaxID=121845 RepID=A0A1S3DPZ5_DIACI